MLTIQQYCKAKSLDEAYELLQKNRMNQIIAGMLWLRMQERTIPVAIDLCDLHLDMIEEDEDSFTIGAMTSLRALETHEGLQEAFGSLLTDALKDIVGVQFRNTATLGGSLYSRFGFSDVLCALLCLDAEVILHKQGRISLQEYAAMPYERDILTHVVLKKEPVNTAFACVRRSATDLPEQTPKYAQMFNVVDSSEYVCRKSRGISAYCRRLPPKTCAAFYHALE